MTFTKGHKFYNGGEKGWFKKGQPPWNKGTTGLMNTWNKGKKLKPLTDEWKRKISEGNKGKKYTIETKQKISNKLKEFHKTTKGKETVKIIANKNKGSKRNEDTIKKLRESHLNFYKTKKGQELKIKLREERLKQVFPLKNTSIENKIGLFLKELNLEFEQHKIINIPHKYQCDFYIPSLKLVIEADGDYWHNYPIGRDIDHLRTEELWMNDYNCIRLWETIINKLDISSFKDILLKWGGLR